MHKADGVGLSVEQLLRCIRLAGTKADEVVGALKAALQQHEVARVQVRPRARKPFLFLCVGGLGSTCSSSCPLPSVVVVASADPPD